MDERRLEDFDALLAVARRQDEPQRLLFVFARRQLDEKHATAMQREQYRRGQGGHLEPCLVVDKAADEIASFAELAAESGHTGQHWDLVFVSSMSGRGGVAPNSDEADQPLRLMVQAIHEGRVADFAVFDREGTPLGFVL